MGRGASRSKSGGMTVMKDAERKIFIKNTNVSLFEFIQDGCFEKDFVSYCSNRLNSYSCVHWLDPETSEDDHFNQESINQTDRHDFNKGFCFHDKETFTYFLRQFNQITIPVESMMALMCCILTLVAMRRIVTLHPLAYYLMYITIFDALDIFVRNGDILLEAFANIQVLYALQIISRSSCQMLPFAYNFFKHCQMNLYVALVIDNFRFVKEPRRTFERYKPEWIRNVLIVIIALLVTVNSQFFWTFDVAENDSLLLHDRYVKSTFECSFSKTWPLKQSFTEFVWPILDHLAGEILPTIIPLYFSVLYLRLPKLHYQDNNSVELHKYIINLDLLMQLNRAIYLICFTFSLFAIPKSGFFIFKCIYFYYQKSTRFFSKDSQRSKLSFTMFLSRKFNSLEKLLQNLEFIIDHLNCIFILLKFFILYKTMDIIRQQTKDLLSYCLCRYTSYGKYILSAESPKENLINRDLESRLTHKVNDNTALHMTSKKSYKSRRKSSTNNPSCSNCPTNEELLTFHHRSVSFRHPTESLTQCSYNM